MKYIMALDLSLSCSGVTIFGYDGTIKNITSIETNKNYDTALRLKQIADELIELRKIWKIEKIIIEKSFYRYNTSSEQIWKVHGVVNYLFSDMEQIYLHSSTVRKTLTGKGNCDKNYVKNWILKKYKDLKFKNLDESDSLAVGLSWFIQKGIIDTWA